MKLAWFRFCRFLLVTLYCVLSSCAAPRSFEVPLEPLASESDNYFIELLDAGKLPGLQKYESIHIGGTQIIRPLAYPVSFTYVCSKNGEVSYDPFRTFTQLNPWVHVPSSDQSAYYYILEKQSKSSEWRLARAWRKLPDGKLEDLEIKKSPDSN